MGDPFSTTVHGSRHPFTLPVERLAHQPERHVGPLSETPPIAPLSISKIRRKQLRTYKSPSTNGIVELRMETVAHARPAHSASSTASSSTSESDVYAHINQKHVYRTTEPPLPLYHPKGQLALSLPELDPAIFGLSSNAVNIDDHDIRTQLSSQEVDARRSSSRARRPAAKLREVTAGDEDEVNDVGNTVNGRMPPPADAPSQPRSTSPRKRRAAATGAAGGAGGKRRRKEVDDGDGTYPNPVNRRTRNPRGAAAAFASPLAGPAVVAEANAEDIEAEADADQATTAAGEPVEATTRSTRSRRSRAAVPKRRESSASETTSTSVSVSIAANTRNTRSVGAKRSSEDDLPVDTVDAGRQSPAQDAEEKTEAAAAVQSPAGAGDALSHGGDGLLEKNAPTATIPPATADVPMEMDDVTDTTAEPTTSKLASDKGARMPDEHSSDDPRVRTTRSKPASTRPSPLRLTSVEDEDTAQAHPAQSLSMMDVDTPHKIAPVPSAHDDYQAQADVQSPKLKSPSPHIPASAPVPPVTSASIPETSRTVPVTQPPPTKLKADDEKEEGELSDV